MGKGKMQKSSENQKETYQTIIKTAQRLFMELGYRAVSTRQIAELCGISQPALYHHFKNKQSLYIAVIQNVLHQTEMDLQEILTTYQSLTDRLYYTSLYMLLHFEVDMSQMFHDMVHEISSEDQQQIHQWWKKGFLMPVVDIINDAVSMGEMKDLAEFNTDSVELAFFFLNLIKSILQPAYYSRLSELEHKERAEKKAKLIVDIFLNGVGK